MTRYSSTMRDILMQIREGYSPKEIKMAIGIATDKRYKGGNMTGAVNAIEKIKKGLSNHPQVKAVLQRVNEAPEDMEPASPDEGSMAMDQLKFMSYAANKIMEHIQSGGEFPEWMQNKLSGTHEKMKSLYANIEHSEMKEEVELTEELDLDEMKMDDPKLVKAFDKMKKGDTIKLKTSSTISQGKDFVDYVVKSKNVVNKGRVEKITLVTKGNEKAVKKFLYKRDGKVTFAIGDMGASIDDIKEGTWALPDSPKAKDALKKLMSKPIKLGKEGDDASDALYSLIGDDELFDDLYVAGKKNPNGDARPVISKWMKKNFTGSWSKYAIEGVELEEGKSSTGYELYHKDFSSAMAHAYDFAKKKFGIEVDPKEIDDKVASGPRKPAKGKTNSYRLKGKDGKKAIQVQVYGMDNGKYELNMYKEGVEPIQWPSQPLEEKLKVSDGLGAWIDDFKKSDAPQFAGKSDEEKKNMAIAAFTDAGGKLDEATLAKELNIDPKDVDKLKALMVMYTRAMKIPSGSPKHDALSREISKLRKDLRMDEETELDEAPKMKYALVGTDMKIYSMGSDERDLRLDRRSLEKRFKDVAPLKMARLKTAQAIGDKVDKSQLKEEEEPNKPDTAKAVDQGREDKKKTRIAQLQLQIAKAQETINKLNAQEKPNG